METPIALNDELEQMLEQQVAETTVPVSTATSTLPVDVRGKYVFRSDPGHRVVAIRIPGVPTSYITEQESAFYRRKAEAKYGKTALKRYERIAERNGDLTITFTPIANKQEGYFVTSDNETAGFLRELIASGKETRIYEDVATLTEEEQTMPTHRAQAALRLKQARQAKEAASHVQSPAPA